MHFTKLKIFLREEPEGLHVYNLKNLGEYNSKINSSNNDLHYLQESPRIPIDEARDSSFTKTRQ